MKRIILGLSMLLMLAQNGFAVSNTEYDTLISEAPNKYIKQVYKCEQLANYNVKKGDVSICTKAVSLLEKLPLSSPIKQYLGSISDNAAVVFYQQGDKINAYKYFMKSAKNGYKPAQKHLDIVCKESPWACK